jgi:hypothetical protein
VRQRAGVRLMYAKKTPGRAVVGLTVAHSN